MDMQFQPGSSSISVRNVGPDVDQKRDGDEPRMYSSRSAGGKLRTSRKNSRKATPYDRPTSGRHATAGWLPSSLSATASSSSLTSRVLGSASRFIASSASYLFPSLFRRTTLGLTNNNPLSVPEVITEEQEKKDELESLTNQKTDVMSKNTTDSEQVLAIVGSEKIKKREFDLVRVEDMLKQKSWSREQVSRLSDLLNTRLTEHSPTVSRLAEAGFQSGDTAAKVIDSTPQRSGENMASPISEAQRWREELKRARTDCMPVEVARAFMGERTSLQSSLVQSFRGTAHQMDRVAELQPPPGLGLAEDRYRSLPVLKSRTCGTASHVLRKGPILEEEWMSIGPVRRTRHKMLHMNSSPYARALPSVDSLAPRTNRPPPVQSSQTARKILDTLEMLTPSPKTKSVNDEHTAPAASDMLSIQGSRNMQRSESFKFSSLKDIHPSNGRLEFGSPSKSLVPITRAKMERHFEDKSPLSRLFSSSEAGLFSRTSSRLSSSPAQSRMTILSMTSPETSSQPESKPLFAFTLPPFRSEISTTSTGETLAVVTARGADLNVSSPSVMTFANVLSKAGAPSLIASGEKEEKSGPGGLSMVPGAVTKASNKVDTEQKLKSFQFGSPSFNSPFAFQTGPSVSPFGAKGLQTALRPDGSSGALSESLFPISQKAPVSPIVFCSSAANSSVTVTETSAPASFGFSLFGCSQGSSSASKSSPSGDLFGASSIIKPVIMSPLTIGASSAPFTFSPPPAPVTCSTPTFSFGNKEVVNAFSEAALSELEDTNSTPVFNFTSPSGGPKLSVASDDIPFPAPTFTFGGRAASSSGDSMASLGQIFSFGTGMSPPLGGLVAESASMTSTLGVGLDERTGSQQPFNFAGQSTNEQWVGSLAGSALPVPVSTAEGSQVAASLEVPVSFASSRSTGLEKAGRRIIKAKRKK